MTYILPTISISIVSHSQIALVKLLLDDIKKHCLTYSLEVILTLNVDETSPFDNYEYDFISHVICNKVPKGFGENHNAAFQLISGQFFCILNPDIRINSDIFEELLIWLTHHPVDIGAPLVLNNEWHIEDSFRRFPSPFKVLSKMFTTPQKLDYMIESETIYPEWIAGMFMIMHKEIFALLGGFDEAFFLYYEDVDFCARAYLAGYRIGVCPEVNVIHNAQRQSHRSIKYLRWHITSMIRFFLSTVYWRTLFMK